MDFPGGSEGKESACNAGDPGLIPGSGRSPGGGHGNPFQYACLENPHGQRSLSDYSPWGHKELDTTEQLSTAPLILIISLVSLSHFFLLQSVCFTGTQLIFRHNIYNQLSPSLVNPYWFLLPEG